VYVRWSAKFASTFELLSWTNASFHSIVGVAFVVIAVMRSSFEVAPVL
jgi:hypothetical protein